MVLTEIFFVLQWLDSKVLGWLTLVYSGNCRNTNADCIEGFKGRLLHFMYETFAKTHIDQLFNIIIEFPESEPAILDLKVCLEKTDLRGTLVTSLKTALETRLLHPGFKTFYILFKYMYDCFDKKWLSLCLYLTCL